MTAMTSPLPKTSTRLQTDWTDPTPERPMRYPRLQVLLVRGFFQTIGRIFPGWAAQIAYKLFATPQVRARHRTSDAILESARLFDVLYGSRIIKGYAWGEKEAPTVLLVHGWNSRGTALRTFVPDLLERGYRVVAMDGPAHGNSGGKRTNLVDFAGSVRAMINHIGQVAGIITHSFGGAATVYALKTSDFAEERVGKLVLVGVPASMDRVIAASEDQLGLPPVVRRRFREFLMNKIDHSFEELDSAEFKNGLGVERILVVHDTEDAVVNPKSAHENYSMMENADLLLATGYGHYRLMKNPDLIRAVGAFLDA